MNSQNHRPSADQTTGQSFTIKRRRRWPWVTGLIVLVAVIGAGLASFRYAGEASTIPEPGSVLDVAYLESNPAEQAILEYVSSTLGPAHGVKVRGVSLSDSTQINRAVSDGKIAGTIFQHRYWLGQVMAANPAFQEEPGTGPIFHWIFGVWSEKYHDLQSLPQGARISIPADPANEAQALWLLENAGLIKLRPGVEPWTAGLDDISENPRNFSWTLLDLGAQPRGLTSLDAVIGYAESFLASGIAPEKLIYSPKSPDQFASVLTIGSRYRDTENIKNLIKAFEDPKLQTFIFNDPRTKPIVLPTTDSPSTSTNAGL
ncbi:ABC-type metal ion transport system, substrate-binding protein/surface antigen [Arboricoccus pini]|uniref:ABC-type metal ion transport system, substrate-binding protein/surface antigen n=1 Tax=Arboricoccus pini TaxID=1963835 RepID=A0A212RFR5_9PROT|nr:MetQ/NlpA family ABC transporter substrate-binding protein [Arboricoccus pini]SNB71205.1 ABC-type metal ion transport system, substrate-binding protein/surface antigen [Arboricoccus pini]